MLDYLDKDLPPSVAEVYYTHDKTVCKVVHVNGSETTIKVNQSCDGTIDNNKAVVFISSSVGCQQKCKFCYLTAKNYPYEKIYGINVSLQVIDALKAVEHMIKGKYLKLSFMGMGDIFAEDHNIISISLTVFRYALRRFDIKGIDGVDVGTCMPNYSYVAKHIEALNELNFILLSEFRDSFNENHLYTVKPSVGARTPVRLFVSFHSTDDDTRKMLMPKSVDKKSLTILLKECKVDIIFHCLFFELINDDLWDINDLYDFVSSIEHSELRALRFNKCDGIELNESRYFWEIVHLLKHDGSIRVKYQISTGKEILASCGQFICQKLKAEK